ncbi:MAG TPA: lipopolysaccharide kinase InaA family protein [Methylomirabilota bacterium]|nr:lipopolysaccharide kinase InaA family protein [Methylomirabilota bacterium]
MNDYIAAPWQRIFEFNGLRSFDDFWRREAEWFEEPNQRRGGWSGVARCELKHPDGGTVRVFLKRQENHVTRTWVHPFRGLPTFIREFDSIMRYRRRGIPTLTPIYFSVRCPGGDRRAILMTEELTGFRSLEDFSREWKTLSAATRVSMARAVARLLRQIHSQRLSHNCFYPKHVFLRIGANNEIETRIIDLEKTKWRLFGLDRDFRDMRRLNGPGLPWSRAERLRFFKEYLGVTKLTPAVKEKWRRIARRHFEKHPADAALFGKTAAAN